jgi:hypothetical protein
MIDGYLASKIARMEYEERVQALVREEKLLNDILPDDLDVWIAHRAGAWRFPKVGCLLSAFGSGLAAIGEKVKRERGMAHEVPPSGQQESSVLS